jgi:hypothetical protein
LAKTAAQSTPDKVRLAFELCFSREPTDAELADSAAFIEESGLPQFCRAMLNANELVFVP